MDDIPSPCIRNCTLDEQDICLGCYRSLQEIVEWAEASTMKKQAIVEAAAIRRALKKIERKTE